MGLFGVIKNLLEGETFKSLDTTQERAFVDALTYTMLADEKVASGEEKELADALRPLKWKGSEPLESYVNESMERARQVSESGQSVRAYLSDISDRLAEDWIRDETYYIAARLAASDNSLDQLETAYLRVMVEEFDIPEDRFARISDQLIRETDFS
ncbi:MAG: hypothetical protein ACQEVA_09115 [Myxococcota bacterium]